MREPREPERRRARDVGLGVFDAIGLALAGIGVIVVWSVQLFAVPAFRDMFRDFGGELPALTTLVMTPHVAISCTAIALLFAFAGVAMRLARPTRAGTVLIAIAVAAPMLTLPLMVYALYLPVFEIAASVGA